MAKDSAHIVHTVAEDCKHEASVSGQAWLGRNIQKQRDKKEKKKGRMETDMTTKKVSEHREQQFAIIYYANRPYRITAPTRLTLDKSSK